MKIKEERCAKMKRDMVIDGGVGAYSRVNSSMRLSANHTYVNARNNFRLLARVAE